MELEVMDADSCDDMSFPPGVTGAVGERHLVVALTRPQQTEVLTKYHQAQSNQVTIEFTSHSFV